MASLTLGQLAQRARVGVETIRFYEREGLIPEPPRRPSGYRDYPPETVDRIVFIRRAKELGFTLKEINELLELRVRPRRNCSQVKQSADAKIAGIDEIILTRVPVKVEGPGFFSDLFGGGWSVQLVRAILFLMGAAVVLGLFAATVLSYSFLTAAVRRRRIGRI